MNSASIKAAFAEHRIHRGLQHSASSKIIHHAPVTFALQTEKR